jgi:hypothetical protein
MLIEEAAVEAAGKGREMHPKRFLPGWARLVLLCVISAYALTLLYFFLEALSSPERFGVIIGRDFVPYYAASRLALEGALASGFDMEVMHQAEAAIFESAREQGMVWLYPPTFALLVLPLGLVGPFLAFVLWNLLGALAYGWMMWRIRPGLDGQLLAFAFSGSFVCLMHGQNALLLTAAAGFAALFLLDGRQRASGTAIALLAAKPHLAVLWPVALAAGRCWRAFLAAAGATLAFLLLSTAVFGTDYWAAFLEFAPKAQAALLNTEAFWPRLASLYATLRIFGASIQSAFLLHFLLGVAALLLVALLWLRNGAKEETLAALLAGACLFPPYVVFYDLLFLAPALLLLSRGLDSGCRSRVRSCVLVSLIAGAMPLLIWARVPAAADLGVLAPLAVFFLCVVFAYHRGRKSDAA